MVIGQTSQSPLVIAIERIDMEKLNRIMFLVVRPDGSPTSLLFKTSKEAKSVLMTLNGVIDPNTRHYSILNLEVQS